MRVLFIIPEYSDDYRFAQLNNLISAMTDFDCYILCKNCNLTKSIACNYQLNNDGASYIKRVVEYIKPHRIVIASIVDLHFIMYALLDFNIPIVLSIDVDPRVFVHKFSDYNYNECIRCASCLRIQLDTYANYYNHPNIKVIPNFILENKQFIYNKSSKTIVSNNYVDIHKVKYIRKFGLDFEIYQSGSAKNSIIYADKLAFMDTSFYSGMSQNVLQAASFGLPIIARKSCLGTSFLTPKELLFEDNIYFTLKRLLTYTQIKYNLTPYMFSNVLPQWIDMIQSAKVTEISSNYRNYLTEFRYSS